MVTIMGEYNSNVSIDPVVFELINITLTQKTSYLLFL